MEFSTALIYIFSTVRRCFLEVDGASGDFSRRSWKKTTAGIQPCEGGEWMVAHERLSAVGGLESGCLDSFWKRDLDLRTFVFCHTGYTIINLHFHFHK